MVVSDWTKEDIQEVINQGNWVVHLEKCKKCDLVAIADFLDISIVAAMTKAEIKKEVLKELFARYDSADNQINVRNLGALQAAVENDEVSEEHYESVDYSVAEETGARKKLVSVNVEAIREEEMSDELRGKLMEIELQKAKMQYDIEKEKLGMERELAREKRESERENRGLERERLDREERLEREKMVAEREENERKRAHELAMRADRPNPEHHRESDIVRNMKMVPKFSEQDVTGFFIAFEKVAEYCQWPENKW